MQLVMRDAHIEDLRRIFEIRIAALVEDFWTRVSKIVYPHGRSTETVEKGMRSWKDDLAKERHFLKVVVEPKSQKIIAFAKWHLVAEISSRTDWDKPYEGSSAGQEANNDAWRAMDVAKHAMRRRFIAGQAHMYLGYLCTDPAYQGNGAGSLLLRWGTDIADAEGLPSFLLSTESGHSLYNSRGFEDFEAFELDGSTFGVPQVGHMWFMRRLPHRRDEETDLIVEQA